MAKTPALLASDPDIHAALVDRIDVRQQGVGLVVGVIDARGRRVVAHGERRKGGGSAVDGDTVFEIGSITKVFTALLLAEMAERGEVALDDPVARYLPAGVTAPSEDGRAITLIDLATHTSGLPLMDPDFRTTDPAHPFAVDGQAQALAGYTVERLYRFLRTWRPKRAADARYAYSNLGLGLLGHVLALRAGVDFETLLRQRITAPLGMADTAISLPEHLQARLASGHNERLEPVAKRRLQALAGAGALCSTANDLLAFMAAELGYVETPLRAAMDAQLAARRPMTLAAAETALGWHVSTAAGRQVVWHSGATVGSVSWLGFDHKRGAGVVVLNNARKTTGANIGLTLLSGTLRKPIKSRSPTLALAAPALEAYVGRYRLSSGSILVVSRDGDRLFAQLMLAGSDRPRPMREIQPRTRALFRWANADVEATFELDDAGQATGLVMHWSAGDTVGTRLAGS